MTDSYSSETEGFEYSEKYYIVYRPLSYDLHNIKNQATNQEEIIANLTGLDFDDCKESNYIRYTVFKKELIKKDWRDSAGIYPEISYYIGALISRADPGAKVMIADDLKRNLFQITGREGREPTAVFIIFHSKNFISAAACTVVLQKGNVPVVAVCADSQCTQDHIERFINEGSEFGSISFLKKRPDGDVIREIVSDLEEGRLNRNYTSSEGDGDGMWNDRNVAAIKNPGHDFVRDIPLAGFFLKKKVMIREIPVERKFRYDSGFTPNNFLSGGYYPEHRKFCDVVNELLAYERDGHRLSSRMYYFAGMDFSDKNKIYKYLDKMIMSPLSINYMLEVTADLVMDEVLLRKLRASGLSLAQLPLYSLDLRNIEIVDPELAQKIKDSKMTPEEYYSGAIKKLNDSGVMVVSVFLFGMPFDGFTSLNEHSGKSFASFCRKNKTGISVAAYNEGMMSKTSSETDIVEGSFGNDLVSFMLSISIEDAFVITGTPSESWQKSPLAVFYSMYDAVKSCNRTNVKKTASGALKAWKKPTANGFISPKERFYDSIAGMVFSNFSSSLLQLLKERVNPGKKTTGVIERLYEEEKNPDVKEIFRGVVS